MMGTSLLDDYEADPTVLQLIEGQNRVPSLGTLPRKKEEAPPEVPGFFFARSRLQTIDMVPCHMT